MLKVKNTNFLSEINSFFIIEDEQYITWIHNILKRKEPDVNKTSASDNR